MEKKIYKRYPLGNKRFLWKQKEYTLSTFSYLGKPDEEGERLLEIVDRATKNCKEALIKDIYNINNKTTTDYETNEPNIQYSLFSEFFSVPFLPCLLLPASGILLPCIADYAADSITNPGSQEF